MIELFDGYGHISADIDPAAVEAMGEIERDALMRCLAAARAAELGEDRVLIARKHRDELNRSHDEALAADIAANPPYTHQQALLAVSEANRPGHKPKPARANENTRKALAAVIDELSEARAELTQAEAALRTLSTARGNAVLAYINSGERASADKIHRQMVEAEADRKLAGIAPKVATVQHQSQLDAVLAGPGKSISRGSKRPVYPVR